MKPWGKLIVGVSILALCAGCFRLETLIKLENDGSGKLFIRALVSESLDTKDDLRAKAKDLVGKLGEGVSYVDSKEIVKKGWKGIQSEYHFTDIRKLKIGDLFNDTKKDDDKQKPAKEGSNIELAFLSGEKDGPWRFEYKQGDSNELIAYQESPAVKAPADGDPFAAAGVELDAAPTASIGNAFAGALLRPMLIGARASMTLQVPGEIVETNAPSAPTSSSNSVHLFDLNLAKFAESKQFDQAILESWSIDRLVKEKVPGISAAAKDEKILVRFMKR